MAETQSKLMQPYQHISDRILFYLWVEEQPTAEKVDHHTQLITATIIPTPVLLQVFIEIIILFLVSPPVLPYYCNAHTWEYNFTD